VLGVEAYFLLVQAEALCEQLRRQVEALLRVRETEAEELLREERAQNEAEQKGGRDSVVKNQASCCFHSQGPAYQGVELATGQGRAIISKGQDVGHQSFNSRSCGYREAGTREGVDAVQGTSEEERGYIKGKG